LIRETYTWLFIGTEENTFADRLARLARRFLALAHREHARAGTGDRETQRSGGEIAARLAR
jgi:hypothetical protein